MWNDFDFVANTKSLNGVLNDPLMGPVTDDDHFKSVPGYAGGGEYLYRAIHTFAGNQSADAKYKPLGHCAHGHEL